MEHLDEFKAVGENLEGVGSESQEEDQREGQAVAAEHPELKRDLQVGLYCAIQLELLLEIVLLQLVLDQAVHFEERVRLVEVASLMLIITALQQILAEIEQPCSTPLRQYVRRL